MSREAADIEFIEVSKQFGNTVAASAVSLTVRAGEFITLLGPSGCGKTTLLRMVAGFETPDSGRVLLGGEDVTRVPPYRRDVTTVFQQYALFPHLNVFDNIAFGLRRRRVEREAIHRRVGEMLEMVQLSGRETRLPSELSGGQQQRVALARALVLEPKVLLLDEPLAALDLKLRKQMQVELKSLQRRLGISFVFVTHDQEEALTMSDRVVVMNAGKIEQSGSPQEIYERPQTEFVAGFIGESNILAGTVAASGDDSLMIRIAGSTDESADAAMFAVAARGRATGESVRVMIRPEKLRLLTGEARGKVQGRIAAAMYQGESTRWRIELAGGQQLTVLEQNHAPTAAIESRIGQSIWLDWQTESAVLLRA